MTARKPPGLTLLRLRALVGDGPLVTLGHPTLEPAAPLDARAHDILEGERQRLRAMEVHEARLRDQGFTSVAGVDEVGRGPLAGPVVAAAVVFHAPPLIPLLNDSKALTEEAREALLPLIQREAAAWSVGTVEVDELTRLGMHKASLEAMHRALRGLSPPPDFVLVDGHHRVPALACPQETLVRGDSRSVSIAAASVVAKVTRDRLMDDLDRRYPGYGFKAHKGYGTADHLQALRSLGPTPIHRPLFGPVAAALAERAGTLELF